MNFSYQDPATLRLIGIHKKRWFVKTTEQLKRKEREEKKNMIEIHFFLLWLNFPPFSAIRSSMYFTYSYSRSLVPRPTVNHALKMCQFQLREQVVINYFHIHSRVMNTFRKKFMNFDSLSEILCVRDLLLFRFNKVSFPSFIFWLWLVFRMACLFLIIMILSCIAFPF